MWIPLTVIFPAMPPLSRMLTHITLRTTHIEEARRAAKELESRNIGTQHTVYLYFGTQYAVRCGGTIPVYFPVSQAGYARDIFLPQHFSTLARTMHCAEVRKTRLQSVDWNSPDN